MSQLAFDRLLRFQIRDLLGSFSTRLHLLVRLRCWVNLLTSEDGEACEPNSIAVPLRTRGKLVGGISVFKATEFKFQDVTSLSTLVGPTDALRISEDFPRSEQLLTPP